MVLIRLIYICPVCRFVFDDDSLEVVIAGKEEQQTENAFVGGRNRWRYDTFVNWELWWPGFPILVYFKVRNSHCVHYENGLQDTCSVV
jgi:hypothetical protein